MRVNKTEKKKKKESEIEKMVFGILEKSMKAALDHALGDFFKEWNNKNINIKL